MPLTEFQREVFRVIAANRSVESHVAGGIVLNADANSPRVSKDRDIFQDAKEALHAGSEADCASLEKAGYQIEREWWKETFRRAWVSRGAERVRLEWAEDSAWRFFPVERDAVLGWKLHRFDALTNKALAMGSRSETRDMVDLVVNHDACPLCTVVWAACSKDAGFNPMSLLEQMRRFSKIDAAALVEMKCSFSPVELKTKVAANRRGRGNRNHCRSRRRNRAGSRLPRARWRGEVVRHAGCHHPPRDARRGDSTAGRRAIRAVNARVLNAQFREASCKGASSWSAA